MVYTRKVIGSSPVPPIPTPVLSFNRFCTATKKRLRGLLFQKVCIDTAVIERWRKRSSRATTNRAGLYVVSEGSGAPFFVAALLALSAVRGYLLRECLLVPKPANAPA